MNNEHHDLFHEFPEFHTKITALRDSDAQFAREMATYEELDSRIRLDESKVAPIADAFLGAMKFRRVHLKDDLYARLRKSA